MAIFLAYCYQPLAHVTSILLLDSSVRRTDRKAPCSTESMFDGTTPVCACMGAHTHVTQESTRQWYQTEQLAQREFVIFPPAEWGASVQGVQ